MNKPLIMRARADFDAVVIGAGAAGLAAGRRLQDHGASFIILEARERIGGRAHSRTVRGFAIDLGCGWLHSADRNPWTRIAAGLGFTIETSAPQWGEQTVGAGDPPAERAQRRAAFDAFFARIGAAPLAGGDLPASALLDPGGRFNPAIGAACAYINGAELAEVSVADWRRYEHEDSGQNWRVAEGYGAAIAAFGAGLPVRLGCVATLIDHCGPMLGIETTQGRISAEAAIVTLPTNLLAAEALRFLPALPDKVEAAHGLPLGVADKLVLAGDLDGLRVGHAFGDLNRTQTGSYELRPFGRPLIEAYFGGALARGLEAQGRGAFFDFAKAELDGLFGADFAARLEAVSETAWGEDCFARGSYSHAAPGRSDQRSVLAAPVDGRLFFAGEACSLGSFSTAHGAYLTGVAAADALIGAGARKSAP